MDNTKMENNPVVSNGWREWQRHILAELERLNESVKDLTLRIDCLREQVIVLRTKASIYGALAGFIITVAVQLLLILIKY